MILKKCNSIFFPVPILVHILVSYWSITFKHTNSRYCCCCCCCCLPYYYHFIIMVGGLFEEKMTWMSPFPFMTDRRWTLTNHKRQVLTYFLLLFVTVFFHHFKSSQLAIKFLMRFAYVELLFIFLQKKQIVRNLLLIAIIFQ